jgi:hypothetical protein
VRISDGRLVDRYVYKAKDFEGVDHWNHTIDLAVAKCLSIIPIVLRQLGKIEMQAVLV